MVRLLCEAGADKDKASQSGVTPLHLASLSGHRSVVQFLCEAGAQKGKATRDSATALPASGISAL